MSQQEQPPPPPPALPELRPPPPLPKDWEVVQHVTHGILWVHTPTRVCSWTRPYAVDEGEVFESHTVPTCVSVNFWDPNRGRKRCNRINNIENSEKKRQRLEEIKAQFSTEGDPTRTQEIAAAAKLAIASLEPELPTSSETFPDIEPVGPRTIVKSTTEGGEGGGDGSTWVAATRAPVAFLHGYCVNKFQLVPVYRPDTTVDARNPFSCTILLNDVEHMTCVASNKKKAKQAAALALLYKLCPEYAVFYDPDSTHLEAETTQNDNSLSELSLLPVDDPKICEHIEKCGKSPIQLLTEMGMRYPAMSVKYDLNYMEDTHLFSVTAFSGPHQVTVTAKSKKDGRQRAAASLLCRLYPSASTWGDLLDLFSAKKTGGKLMPPDSCVMIPGEECDLSEMDLALQSHNYALLAKVKQAMRTMLATREGTLEGSAPPPPELKPSALPLPLTSSCDSTREGVP